MDDPAMLAAGRLTEAMLGVGKAGVAHTLLPGAAEVMPAGEIMRRSHRALPATESSPKTRLSRGWWQQDQDVGCLAAGRLLMGCWLATWLMLAHVCWQLGACWWAVSGSDVG